MTMSDKPQKVLIVDDDNDNRGLLVDRIGMEGYTVFEAPDGQKGLELAIKEHPDLILLDILMPKMTGMEVMEKLRQDPWGKDAAIFFLTNVDPDDTMIEKISKYTPSYYFLKKADMLPEEMMEKIRENLNN